MKHTLSLSRLLSTAVGLFLISSCSLLVVKDKDLGFPLNLSAEQLALVDANEILLEVLSSSGRKTEQQITGNCYQFISSSRSLVAESCYFLSDDRSTLMHKTLSHEFNINAKSWFKRVEKFNIPLIFKQRLEKSIRFAEFSSDKPVVMFILDTSGSMADLDKGEAKIVTARKSIIDTMSQIDSDRYNTSLVTFDKGSYCEAEVVVSPNNNDPEVITRKIKLIEPNGPTPLAKAIALSGNALSTTEKKMVILFSDGVESCDGDPVKEAEKLDEKYGIKINLQVIGYGVNKKSEQELRKISQLNSEWNYHKVEDPETLEKAINTITKQGQLLDPLWLDRSTSTFQFDMGSANLDSEYRKNIEKIYNFLKHNSKRIQVIGHTDSSGSNDSNMKLSIGRAMIVKNKLVELGVSAERIEVTGKGESEPVSSNDSDLGRRKNRRVVINVI